MTVMNEVVNLTYTSKAFLLVWEIKSILAHSRAQAH